MTTIVTTQEELDAAIESGAESMVKVTGKPHPAGSPAWRAIMGGYVNRIGVGHDRSGQGFRWRVRCGLCMEPVGPVCHPTWQEAMAAADAHADYHRRENAARERATDLANTEGATE